jgi:hypothetical protein
VADDTGGFERVDDGGFKRKPASPGILKSIGVGAARGLGGPGTTRDMILNAPQAAADALGVQIPEGIKSGARTLGNVAETAAGIVSPAIGAGLGLLKRTPTSEQTGAVAEQALGTPQTPGENIAASVAEGVANPMSYIGPGGAAAKAVTGAAGGAGSEILGQLLKGDSAEPYARIIGAVLGGAAPGGVSRVITPIKQVPGRAGAVATLRKEGIEPTAGDVTGSRTLQRAESSLGSAPGAGGAYEEAQRKVVDDYTRAALARVGETATEVSPPVIQKIDNRIGGQFQALAARNRAPWDTQFMNEMFQHLQNYEHLIQDPMRGSDVKNVFEATLNYLRQGRELTGQQYKVFRSKIGKMLAGARDSQVQEFLAGAQDSLDGLMERAIQQNNPADLGAFKEVRNQYRNFLVLQKIATGASEAARAGKVSAPDLQRSTISTQGRGNYAKGKGDYSDLAHAGAIVFGNRPPTSGTAERGLIQHIPAVLGAGIGGTLGAMFGGPIGAVGGGLGGLELGKLAGAAAPGLTGRAIMSKPGQAYLKNQAIKGKPFRGGGSRAFQEALAKELAKAYGGPQE